MKTKWFSVAFVAAGMALTPGAFAQTMQTTQTTTTEPMSGEQTKVGRTAPDRAVELSIGTGYAQGFGTVASGQPTLTDVGGAGGLVDLGVGYRFDPRLMLGAYASGAEFSRGSLADPTATLYSATAGVQANWHFIPGNQVDPWIGLGTGWRGFWANADRGTVSQHGLQLARLQLGLDLPVSTAVAISPVLGADLSILLIQKTPATGGYNNIQSPNVNTFIFAGVLGRFDIPTSTTTRTTTIAANSSE